MTIISMQKRSRRVRPWAPAFILSASLATITVQGCSSSASVPDESQAPSVIASAFCGAMRDCCTAANFAYEDAACMSQIETYVSAGFLWTEGKGTAYNGEAVGGCANAMKSLEAKCVADESVVDSAVNHGVPAVFACQLVHNATKAPGDSCQGDQKCASSSSAAGYCAWYSSRHGRMSAPVLGHGSRES